MVDPPPYVSESWNGLFSDVVFINFINFWYHHDSVIHSHNWKYEVKKPRMAFRVAPEAENDQI